MDREKRTDLLHQIAKDYVIKGPGAKNFDIIPYHEEVTLHAPINPGGSKKPMVGRATLKANWWAPLPDLVKGTTFLESYVNEDLSAVTAEFYCDIIEPSCRLRIIDRFRVNAEGQITDQENFFDPRPLTNPS